MKVFFVLDWSSIESRYPILGSSQFPILISAATLWIRTKGRYLWKPKLPPHRELIIDSGAFSLLSSLKDYPFSFEDYISLAYDYRPDFIAARDWPCEPYGRIQIDTAERIRRTVEADAQICDATLPNGTRPLPVIQGWTVRDYLSCIGQLREAGLIRPYMAVGSCCKRSNIRQVMEIARAIRAELPTVRLHYFGLKIQAFRQPGFVYLADSTDTGAWALYGKFIAPWKDGACSFCGKRQEYEGAGHLHRMPASRERMQRFYAYLRKLVPTEQEVIDAPRWDAGT